MRRCTLLAGGASKEARSVQSKGNVQCSWWEYAPGEWSELLEQETVAGVSV